MKNLTADEFLVQHLTEEKSYQQISEENGVDRKTLSQWWDEGNELRKVIKKANQLFNNKKSNEDFKKFMVLGRRKFYEWYRDQEKVCCYCGSKEEHLKALFDKESGILSTKRTRGASLELERIDSTSNEYSQENCTLACYFCNNHKSDIISAEDHKTYFAPAIGKYVSVKYNEMIGNDK